MADDTPRRGDQTAERLALAEAELSSRIEGLAAREIARAPVADGQIDVILDEAYGAVNVALRALRDARRAYEGTES